MAYKIKVGSDSQSPVLALNQMEVQMFLTGLLMGDGRDVEKATALAESTARRLAYGFPLPDGLVTEMFSDGRPVYAWREEVPA